ncbi:MAG TPA: hypothetical protein VJB02_06110 [Coxiellaceae bacterium]|nr:hypothetical protein [Coxiellaceae bacterium]
MNNWLLRWKEINWKKFWLALIAVFALSSLLEWGMHAGMLTSHLTGLSKLWNDVGAQSFTLWMWAGYFVFSWAFVWIYANGWENKSWFGQGFRYGVMIWLLWSVPVALMYYTGGSLDFSILFKKIGFELIVTLILAWSAALLYRPSHV